MADVDLNLLRVLDAVLEQGSASRAARRLGMSQSAVSHALARLRTAVGDDLVVRSGNRMQATPRGEALRERVRAALQTLDAALQPVSFVPAQAQRTLRLSMVDYASMLLLPALTARLAQEAPGVQLRVPPDSHPLDALVQDQTDMVVGVFGSELDRSDLFARSLWDDRLVCVLRQGHPALAQWGLPAFLALPHLQIAPGGRPGGPLDDRLAAMGFQRRVMVAAPHFLALPFSVAGSDAVATIPARIAAQLAPALGLAIVPLPVPVGGFTTQLVWHRRSQDDAGHQWLRALVQAAIPAE